MKVFLNCSTKPSYLTLFKGEKSETETKTQIKPQVKPSTGVKPQPQADTVEINNKKDEPKCVCKCETCK